MYLPRLSHYGTITDVITGGPLEVETDYTTNVLEGRRKLKNGYYAINCARIRKGRTT